jgi:hypothetical protein
MNIGACLGFLISFIYLIFSTRHVAPVVKFDAIFFGFIGCIIAAFVGGIVEAILVSLFRTFSANATLPNKMTTCQNDGWEIAKEKLYSLFQGALKIAALIGLIVAVYTAFCR